MIFYESPYRVVRCLEQLAEVFGPERRAAVSRELTKKFGETVRGTLDELAAHFREQRSAGRIRGGGGRQGRPGTPGGGGCRRAGCGAGRRSRAAGAGRRLN